MNNINRNANNNPMLFSGLFYREFGEGGGVVSARALAHDGHLAFCARGRNDVYLSWKIMPYLRILFSKDNIVL